MHQRKRGFDRSEKGAVGCLGEPTVRAALSGLGYDLQWEMGAYVISDRRAAMDLKADFEIVACSTLDEIVALFRLR